MLKYLLDTNLCIRVLRDRPPGLRERFNSEASGLCISSVIVYELLQGAAKSARPVESRREVEAFAARLEVLDFDAEVAAHAGEIRAEPERQGQPFGSYHVLIAGRARSRGLIVVTGNLGEFRRADDLRYEDWDTKATRAVGVVLPLATLAFEGWACQELEVRPVRGRLAPAVDFPAMGSCATSSVEHCDVATSV